jgi:monoamine oxidase
MDDADRADLVRVEGEFAALARGVDPGDPWGHPDAQRLDSLSVGDWLRAVGARPGVVRLLDHMARSLSIDSIERTSLLAQLRKEAVCGAHGFYDERRWEHLRVAEGSATVALRIAGELGELVRLGASWRPFPSRPRGAR